MIPDWVSLSRVSQEGARSVLPDDPLTFVSVASVAPPPFKTSLFLVRCKILQLFQQSCTVQKVPFVLDQCCLQCWSCSYSCLVWLNDQTNRGLSLCQHTGLAEITNSSLSTDNEALGFWGVFLELDLRLSTIRDIRMGNQRLKLNLKNTGSER